MAESMVDKMWNLFFKDQAEYAQDPEKYLVENGFEDCTYDEIVEAVSLSFEKGPVNQGATVLGTQTVAAIAPPPPPSPALPPLEQVKQTVNYYYESNAYNETHVDDRDTNVDSSVNTNVFAEDSHIDLDIDNETTTASGDRAVAAGDDVEGVATGDGAVAAGDDINAPVVTGGNSGIVAEDSNIEGVAVGDGNTVVNDSTNVATGSGNVSDDDIDVDITDSDLEGVNIGDGSAEYTDIDDSFNQTDNSIDASINDSFDTEDSFNTQDSFNTEDSFNLDIETVEPEMVDPV
jgi:hypothetical protein